MEEQIREQFEKAFWTILDDDPTQEHLRKLLNEIVEKLCLLVPSRSDIHQQIKDDFQSDPIDWSVQTKLLIWVEKFQAPIYDQVTRTWKGQCPEPTGQFLKKYYQHLEKVYHQVQEHRSKTSSFVERMQRSEDRR